MTPSSSQYDNERSFYMKIETYNNLLGAMEAAQDVGSSLRALRALIADGVEPTLLQQFVDTAEKDLDKAVEAFVGLL